MKKQSGNTHKNILPDPREESLSLADYLAADRTIFANERTLLAYIRTVLTLVIGGVSLIHFFNNTTIRVLGISLIGVSFFVFALATIRYRQNQKRLAILVRSYQNEQENQN